MNFERDYKQFKKHFSLKMDFMEIAEIVNETILALYRFALVYIFLQKSKMVQNNCNNHSYISGQ